jgi:organic hydroperoxide reductase OsmC/OhrA
MRAPATNPPGPLATGGREGTTADNGFALAAELTVTLPGLTDEQKRAVVEGAHQICPYSQATRGNIQVDLAMN